MAREVRTNVVIAAETKGFDQALRKTLGINQSALDSLKAQAKSFTEVQKSIKGMESQLGGLAKKQLDLSKQMEKVKDKGSDAYKQLQGEMKKTEASSKNLVRSIKLQEQAYGAEAKAAQQLAEAQKTIGQQQERQNQERERERTKSKGAFTQGLLQAAAPGVAPLFLQRGPGMGRQAAGMALGGLARRGAGFGWGMTGGAAFTGLQGMQQGLASMPVVGGFLAGQLGAAAGYAQQALGWQRQRVELSPYLGGVRPGVMEQADAKIAQAGLLSARTNRQLRGKAAMMTPGAAGLGTFAESQAARGRSILSGDVAESAAKTKLLQRAVTQARKELGQPEKGAMPSVEVTSEETYPNWYEQSTKYKKLEKLREDVRDRSIQLYSNRLKEIEVARRTGKKTSISEQYAADYDAAKQYTRGTLVAKQTAEQRAIAEAQNLRRKEAQRGFSIAGEFGAQFRGLAKPEAAQEAAAIMQAAGGVLGGGLESQQAGGTWFKYGKGKKEKRLLSRQEEFLATAMAAQTMYGVGPEVTGAFGMAGRRGGLVGGAGKAAEGLTTALEEATRLGLEGSEVNQYLQIIASGIQNFQRTGIPMAKESLNSMALELNKGGLAATRAMTVARGFQQYVQGISARGPTSGLDLMLMQEFGGYKGGETPEELEQVFIRMEKMAKETEEGGAGAMGKGTPMGNILKRLIMQGGRGNRAGGTFLMRSQLLQKMGIGISAEETSILSKQVTGAPLSKEEQKWMAEEEERRKLAGGGAKTPEELMSRAAQRITDVGPNLRQQAELTAKQLQVGEQMATLVKNLELSATNTTKAFGDLAGPVLTEVSNSMLSLTDQMAALTTQGGDLLDVLSMLGKRMIGLK